MTRAGSEPADVLVVGAGPVGLALAIDLARRGVAVRVIDELPAPTTESRAIAIHSRSLDHLQALGVLDDLLERGVLALGMDFHDNGRVTARVSFEQIEAVHRFSLSIAQTETEAVLTARLAGLGVTIERDATLTGLTQDEAGVTATIRGRGGSASARVQYLVGTDGARSTVRHLIGEKLEGSFTGEDFLIGDVEADYDLERSRFHTFFSPGASTGLLFPLPGDRVRVFAELPPGTDPERPATLDWLQEALDERGMPVRVRSAHWLTRFELKHGQVQRYRLGRVFLAGDAAHIHSPAGGLGMNTGIQDALNLGWKLARAVSGTASEALLESYHRERHPVAAEVIAFTTRLSRAGTLQSPVARQVRNTLMHFGLQVPAIAERIADTVEQQSVHYRESPIVSGRGRSIRAGDFLFAPGAAVADALAHAPDHVAVRMPDATEPLPDTIPELAMARPDAATLGDAVGLRDGGFVVVRPDGYVGAIAGDREAVDAYLARLGG